MKQDTIEKESEKKDIARRVMLTIVLAMLLILFLYVSSRGFEGFEIAKYILIVIVPLLVYLGIKDMFK